MLIVFIHVGNPFDGDALNRGALGGTETALIGVTRELANIEGNEIHVFTNTPVESTFSGVHYHFLNSLFSWSKDKTVDVLISVRQWIPLWLPFRVRMKIYFSPDAYDQPFIRRAFDVSLAVEGKGMVLPFLASQYFFDDVDYFFCVGQWQKQTFVEKLGFPEQKFFVTGNAIFPENFTPLPLEKRKQSLLYSATPFRGLDHLVRYFPEIKNQVAAAHLIVCSSMRVYGVSAEQDEKDYGVLYREIQKLDSTYYGSIQQKDLAALMCKGRVYAYPNTFDETFCISVLEAQAAGMVVVTSDRAGLKERITNGVNGILIPGQPGSAEYDRLFMQNVVMALSQNEFWNNLSHNAVKTAATQTYDRLALQWQSFFSEKLKDSHREVQYGSKIPCPTSLDIPHPEKTKTNIRLQKDMIQFFMQQACQIFGFSPQF